MGLDVPVGLGQKQSAFCHPREPQWVLAQSTLSPAELHKNCNPAAAAAPAVCRDKAGAFKEISVLKWKLIPTPEK